MQITTKSGKTFNADWLHDATTRHGAEQLTIQLPGDTDLAEIMAGLVGTEQIEGVKGNGVRNVFPGYTLLSSLIYTPDRSKIRLTLEKKVGD